MSAASEKIGEIIDETERWAAEIQSDARTEASQYLEARRKEADELLKRRSEELQGLSGSLLSRCEQLASEARALAEELDRAIELAEVAGTDTLSALAHCNRGETLLLMGQLDAALAETRRARDIWTRLGSDRVLYALAQLGHVQLLRGQRSEAISIFNETVGLARSQRDTQGAGVALVGLSAALLADDPAAAADAAQRAIDAANATSLPRAHTAAASAALRQSRRPDALRSVTTAIELATTRRDRPALAAALLVRSELDRPPSARFADEAKRLFHDLGNSVGAAMADL